MSVSTSGEDRKNAGMDLAASNKADLLEIARGHARDICKTYGYADADQIAERMEGYDRLGPAAGSIFAGSEWEFTGVRIRSTRLKNNARELKRWRLVGGSMKTQEASECQ